MMDTAVRISSLGSTWFGDRGPLHDPCAGYPPLFYWATYGFVFLVPALGLWHGIRARKRMVINASLVLTLLTLATNKDYLGFSHYAWDPAILGAAMIVAAVALTRWLKGGQGEARNGFTARSLVKPEDHGISLADIGAAAIPGMAGAPPKPPQADRPATSAAAAIETRMDRFIAQLPWRAGAPCCWPPACRASAPRWCWRWPPKPCMRWRPAAGRRSAWGWRWRRCCCRACRLT